MMRQSKLLLLFLGIFHTFIYADSIDIITNYRQNGIENIQKQLDTELTTKRYWDTYLQDKDTTFGYIESYDNILTCNKNMSQLQLYRKDNNSSRYTLQKKYSAFTGKEKGDKFKEGDLKTPVGIYEITKKIEKVDPFYGPLAFVTSYPNTYDKYKGKTGKGIWIHGLPLHQERDEFTKGCIAIDNKSIKCLEKHIDIKRTILIINESDIEKNVSKELLSQILQDIYKWRYAWLYNDLENYLSFYHTDFKRFDGMNKERFSNYKKRIFSRKEKKSIVFKNINILPYPNTKDTFEITFYEIYKSDSFEFKGEKTLIVQFTNSGMKILTEK